MSWILDAQSGNSKRSAPRATDKEIETCALCHSRRGSIHQPFRNGEPLLDSELPAVLTDGLFFADGQMHDEVYNWAPFLQSKMYHQGVTCSDCHNPHTLKLRASGNAVCTQCHQTQKYDALTHHHHQPGTPGAQCAACHMPKRTYMVIDERHDHSMRVPRPDLSLKLGTPNACSECHRESGPEWAAQWIESWYGPQRIGFQTYADTLQSARSRFGRCAAPSACADRGQHRAEHRARDCVCRAWPLRRGRHGAKSCAAGWAIPTR